MNVHAVTLVNSTIYVYMHVRTTIALLLSIIIGIMNKYNVITQPQYML